MGYTKAKLLATPHAAHAYKAEDEGLTCFQCKDSGTKPADWYECSRCHRPTPPCNTYNDEQLCDLCWTYVHGAGSRTHADPTEIDWEAVRKLMAVAKRHYQTLVQVYEDNGHENSTYFILFNGFTEAMGWVSKNGEQVLYWEILWVFDPDGDLFTDED